MVALQEQIEIGKIPWTTHEDNVKYKVIDQGPAAAGGLREKADELEDLDTVFIHVKIYDAISKATYESTRHVQMNPMQPPVESMQVDPKKVILSEFMVQDIIDHFSRKLKDNTTLLIRLAGPNSFYPEGVTDEKDAIIDIKLECFKHVKVSRTPGEGTEGMRSVLIEKSRADGFLKGAIDAKEKLDSFDRMKAAENQQKDEAVSVAWEAKKGAKVSVTRYERAHEFLSVLEKRGEAGAAGDNGDGEGDQLLLNKIAVKVGLARSLVLQQHVFSVEKGEGQDFGKDLVNFLAKKGHKSGVELDAEKNKHKLDDALKYAEEALALSKDQSIPAFLAKAECLGALGKPSEALACIDAGMKVDPKNETLRSERARLNLAEKKQSDENYEVVIADMKARLDVLLEKNKEAKDEAATASIVEELTKLGELVDKDLVAWDALMRTKIGKPVGLVQKAEWADDDLKKMCMVLIRKFRDMAERNRPLWA